MAQWYRTVDATGTSEVEEKKSRFLGLAAHVESEAEAAQLLEKVRKQYYDARHHCYAWVIGETMNQKKAADDGEPSGTAGIPILKVIEGRNCTNTIIIVTRYFGGTLLGTGGLARAYTASAAEALGKAGIICMADCVKLRITLEYKLLDKVMHFLRGEKIPVSDENYTDKVSFQITVRAEESSALAGRITELTAGAVQIKETGRGYMKLPYTAGS